MNNEVAIWREDEEAIARAIRYVRDWCDTHQCELGVAKVALGVSMVAYAVHTGVIGMGSHVVGSAMSSFNVESLVGAATGSTAGAMAAAVLGSIGVAVGGTAIGIPALVLALGGAAVFGASGYVVGDAVHKFLAPSFGDLLQGASLLTVGLVLIVDGARQILGDKRVRAAACVIKDHVLRLGPLATDVVARSRDELLAFARKHEGAMQTVGAVGSTVAVAGGMASLGGLAATGSVTVLGSHALGAAALSLGWVSAPVWPVVAGAAIGLGLGYAAWSGLRRAAGLGRDR